MCSLSVHKAVEWIFDVVEGSSALHCFAALIRTLECNFLHSKSRVDVYGFNYALAARKIDSAPVHWRPPRFSPPASSAEITKCSKKLSRTKKSFSKIFFILKSLNG